MLIRTANMEAPSFSVLVLSLTTDLGMRVYMVETMVINGLLNVFTAIESTSSKGIGCHVIQLADENIIQIPFSTIKEAKSVFEWLHSVSGKQEGKRKNRACPKGVIFTIPIQRKDIRMILRCNHCKDYFVMNTHIPAHMNTIKERQYDR